MRKIALVVLIDSAMLLTFVSPGLARVEDYGPTRYTQVGHEEHHGEHEARGRGHEHQIVIDRRRGPGWGSVAAGIVGAVAGLALGSAVAPPVVTGPPAVGTVLPYLPGACVTVPNYYGGVLYNCGNIYYQPIYEGTSLMYQVVPAP